ncbi:MAG: hypothetical protein HY784_15120, partial [Chloroflexi bacterium]|nr:hypothetical protein [Chloroflexota bacterium]
MSRNDIPLEWQVSEIAPDSALPPTPTQTPRHRCRRRPRRWRLWLLLLVLAGAGLGGYTWYGWQQVRRQIRQHIAYEDARSLARDVEIVRALQADGYDDWLNRRAVEVAAGLPAPLPAGNLFPVPGAVRVEKISAPTRDTVEATVLRTFADSAGVQYQFEYLQRYRNAGSGQWKRLPPDESAGQSIVLWSGQRLITRYPAADAPWAEAALPQIDAALATVCQDWSCPPDLRLPVLFSGALADLPPLPHALRPNDPAPPPYPIGFDLALPLADPDPGMFRMPLLLPSPHLGGYPHDQAAAQALTRAIAVRLLTPLAYELGGLRRAPGVSHYFFGALLARAEIRHRLSPAPDTPVAPGAPSLEALWRADATGEADDLDFRASLDRHARALSLLDFALASRPASTEVALIRASQDHVTLSGWLKAALGEPAEPTIQAWAAAARAAFNATAPISPAELDGLTYACNDGLWLVRDGAPVRLPVEGGVSGLTPQALSRDGRYLAVVAGGEGSQPGLQVLDLLHPGQGPVALGASAYPLGWTAGGSLAYLDVDPTTPVDETPFRLTLYSPETGEQGSVLPVPVFVLFFGRPSLWTPDGRGIALTIMQEGPGEPAARPALVMLEPAVAVRVLAEDGFLPVLSPEGGRAGYAVGSGVFDREAASAAVELLDLQSGSRERILEAGALAGHTPTDVVAVLGWSPDGQSLALAAARPGSNQLDLYLSAPDGSALRQLSREGDVLLPAGFSADSRFLLAMPTESQASQSVVFDLRSEGRRSYAGRGPAWGPVGHRLAIAGSGGVYLTDP